MRESNSRIVRFPFREIVSCLALSLNLSLMVDLASAFRRFSHRLLIIIACDGNQKPISNIYVKRY